MSKTPTTNEYNTIKSKIVYFLSTTKSDVQIKGNRKCLKRCHSEFNNRKIRNTKRDLLRNQLNIHRSMFIKIFINNSYKNEFCEAFMLVSA